MFGLWRLFEFKHEYTRKELWHSVVAGFYFLALGNGAVSWALQYVDTGISALIVSAQPLVLVIMMWLLDRTPIKGRSIIGIVLGMVGIILLVSQKEMVEKEYQEIGMVVIFLCLIVWGYASLYVTKVKMPKSLMLNSGVQMFAGGAILLMASFFTEEMKTPWSELSALTWGSILYLVLFGSVIAFSSFNYLLKHVSPEKVSTSTYINPIVALFLGYYFRDEIITNQSLLASVILLTGVYFINVNRKKKSV